MCTVSVIFNFADILLTLESEMLSLSFAGVH